MPMLRETVIEVVIIARMNSQFVNQTTQQSQVLMVGHGARRKGELNSHGLGLGISEADIVTSTYDNEFRNRIPAVVCCFGPNVPRVRVEEEHWVIVLDKMVAFISHAAVRCSATTFTRPCPSCSRRASPRGDDLDEEGDDGGVGVRRRHRRGGS